MLALASSDSAAAASTDSSRVIEHVQVVCGGARSGKSDYIQSELSAMGALGTVNVSVHEGFRGSNAIEQYLRLVDQRKMLVEEGITIVAADGIPSPLVGIVLNVVDVEGADMIKLRHFLHVLLSCGQLTDSDSGQAACLSTSFRHRIFVELPALCQLGASMMRGPRPAWPTGELVSRRHPFLPKMGPLLLLGPSSFTSITESTWPVRIGASSARVAAFLKFALGASTGDAPAAARPSEVFEEMGLSRETFLRGSVEEEKAFWETKADDREWSAQARGFISDALEAVSRDSSQSWCVGTVAAVVRALEMSLPVLCDLEKALEKALEAASQGAKESIEPIELWARPFDSLPGWYLHSVYSGIEHTIHKVAAEYGGLLSDEEQEMQRVEFMEKHTNKYRTDFFRKFCRLLVHEAVQLMSCEAPPFSVWCMSRKLHDSSVNAATELPHFIVCGDPPPPASDGSDFAPAALVGQLVPDEHATFLHTVSSEEQVATVCEKIAPVFGLGGAQAVRSILEDAGFVLTPGMASQLLQLHGRRRVLEPLVFEGDTGAPPRAALSFLCLLPPLR